MLAPGITPPCASLTTPVIEAVVTPCAAEGLTHVASAHSAIANADTNRDLIQQLIAGSSMKKLTRGPRLPAEFQPELHVAHPEQRVADGGRHEKACIAVERH